MMAHPSIARASRSIRSELVLSQGQPAGCLGADGFPCATSVEVDKKIEHYRRILLSIGDQITFERPGR
jgi:hypothetical protein